MMEREPWSRITWLSTFSLSHLPAGIALMSTFRAHAPDRLPVLDGAYLAQVEIGRLKPPLSINLSYSLT